MLEGKRVVWLCNRKRCADCFKDCKHTTDKEFAVNPKFEPSRFEEKDGDLWEKVPDNG